jgi:hypothetical protein
MINHPRDDGKVEEQNPKTQAQIGGNVSGNAQSSKTTFQNPQTDFFFLEATGGSINVVNDLCHISIRSVDSETLDRYRLAQIQHSLFVRYRLWITNLFPSLL